MFKVIFRSPSSVSQMFIIVCYLNNFALEPDFLCIDITENFYLNPYSTYFIHDILFILVHSYATTFMSMRFFCYIVTSSKQLFNPSYK